MIPVDDTNLGSSLGGKPVTLNKIHDHHMVLQLCTERFYLKSPVHSLFLTANSIPPLTSFCRNSRVLHDTRNLVTSAGEPREHNWLCLIQVFSTAGGAWEAPQLGPLLVFFNTRASCFQVPAAKCTGRVCGNLGGDLHLL